MDEVAYNGKDMTKGVESKISFIDSGKTTI
jgi:hypothetical protein